MTKRKTCRKTKHHKKPRSIGGSNSKENISVICSEEHEAWHRCFRNMTAQEICAKINALFLDPDYYFSCNHRMKRLCNDMIGEP